MNTNTQTTNIWDYIWNIVNPWIAPDRGKGLSSEENNKTKALVPLFILSIMSYYMLRIVKDRILLVLGKGSSMISIVKGLFVFPATILMVIFYSLAVSRYGQKTVILWAIRIFSFALLVLSGGFLFHSHFITSPALLAQQLIEATDFMVFGITLIPVNLVKSLLILKSDWLIPLTYLFSELFGSFAVSMFGWNAAVSVTSSQEAKNIFPILSTYCQISQMLSGLFAMFLDSFLKLSFIESLITVEYGVIQLFVTFLITVGIFFTYNYVYDNALPVIRSKKKKEVGFFEGILVIFRNPVLLPLVIMVICYGLGMGLIELCWKDFVYLHSVATNVGLETIISNQVFFTGFLSLIFSFWFQQYAQKMDWLSLAMMPLVIQIVTGLSFLSLPALYYNGITSAMGIDLSLMVGSLRVVSWAAAIGFAQNTMTKASKYMFFDNSKELAYVPLGDFEKTAGKSAVDMIGGRAGKALSGLIGIYYVAANFTYARFCVKEIMFILLFIWAIWFLSIVSLNRAYIKAVADREASNSANRDV